MKNCRIYIVSLFCCQQPAEVEESPATTATPSSEESHAPQSLSTEDEVAPEVVPESEESVYVDPYYIPVGDPQDVPSLQMRVCKLMLMPPFGGKFFLLCYCNLGPTSRRSVSTNGLAHERSLS